MCGITGMVVLEEPHPRRDQLVRMNSTLEHRGPDDEGYHLAGPVGFAMRRLAIIDLLTGKQPLTNEDGSVVAVFNGEIYNFRELRTDLENRGHTFATETDGEVIVHLWEEYGPEFGSKLNGMFAIALHDMRQQRVVLVRDRIGIKPLFWTLQDRRLLFGSEIKSILASGEVTPELDTDGLSQFLAWEYVPSPGTLFRNIRKLDPGHLLHLDLATGQLSDRCWWDLIAEIGSRQDSSSRASLSTADLAAALDQKLAASVSRRLVSDVPLGAFLSGGVDSSLVVNGMGEARAFSIGFEDPSYDESEWAVKIAEHLRVSHRLEMIRPRASDLFDGLLDYLDDPIGDFSIFPTYLVSKLSREEVKVALSGDGGDELFGGYDTYVAESVAQSIRGIPNGLQSSLIPRSLAQVRPRDTKKGIINKLKRFSEGLAFPPQLGHARWRLFLGETQRQRLLTPEALADAETPIGDHVERLRQEAADLSRLGQSLYIDLKSYLVDNCLVKVDRMSMACSLEVRVPFLDHELVEFAFGLPDHLKIDGRRTKVLLKQVARKHLPASSVDRPKEGFSIPIKSWLKSELREKMEDLLEPRLLDQQGLFRVDEITRLKHQHLSGSANHSHILWSLMVFQNWRHRWNV